MSTTEALVSRLRQIESELRYFDGESPLSDSDLALINERRRIERELRHMPEPTEISDADTLELIGDCQRAHAEATRSTKRAEFGHDSRFSTDVARLLDFAATADCPAWNRQKAHAFKAGMDAEASDDAGPLSNPYGLATPLATCWRAGFYWHRHIMADVRGSRQEMNISTGGL